MKKHIARNERIKREYFRFLKDANGKSDATVDAIRASILRLEHYTRFKDFSTFNREQAIAFKKHLTEQKNDRTGDPLSKATLNSTLNNIKAFLCWLAYQPGYKSKIHIPDTEYLNLTDKEVRIAKTPRYRTIPTLEQIRHTIHAMPTGTEIERRNQAMLAFTILTGVRDSALISLRLKHVNIDAELVMQDPREVKTKFSKRIDTYFFPVGDDIVQIVVDWVRYLKEEKLFGYEAPLFPKTKIEVTPATGFHATGLDTSHWQTTAPVREIFKHAFQNTGLPYFNPHSFRHMLAQLGQKICTTPEQLKAWSQNLGHDNVLTTFTSYGELSTYRQGELMADIKLNTISK